MHVSSGRPLVSYIRTSMDKLTPERLLQGYSQGVFPMAHPEQNNEIYWYAPDPRAVLPIEEFHVSKNLARLTRKQSFEVVCDRDFEGVIEGCAARERTWISGEIASAYTSLHHRGYAHSVECWLGDRLVGGLYGVALRRAFFGESMFFRKSNASKVALVHLFDILQRGGFLLHDIQFMTDHMKRFGAVEIPRHQFLERLDRALEKPGQWKQPLSVPSIVENRAS